MARLPFGGQAGAGAAPVNTFNVEVLDTHLAASAENSYVFTPATPLESTKYSCFRCYGMGAATAALQLRGVLNGDEATAYTSDGYRISAGVETLLNLANQNQFEIINSAILAASDFFAFDLWFWPSIEALSASRAIFWNKAQTDLGYESIGSLWHTSGQESFNLASLEIETSTSTWKQDTWFVVLGYLKVINP